MTPLQMPPIAVVQDDRDRWNLVVPLGMAITIVDCEIVSELVVQTVFSWQACPQ